MVNPPLEPPPQIADAGSVESRNLIDVKVTDVAVAIFQKANGDFLLSSRPEGKPYAGYWEFPGG